MPDYSDQINPLYQQVKNYIVKKIQSGELAPLSKIPSENELVGQLKVSRMTANRAIKELSAEGLLTRIAGVGTFVAEPRIRGHLVEVRNIAEEVRERGHSYSNLVIKHEKIAVTAELARHMELTPRVKSIYHTVIVHKEDGKALQLEDRYVNSKIAPDYINVDLNTTTPSQFLLEKLPLQKVEHTVRAAMPGEKVKKLLEMREGVPCLILDRRTWSFGTLVSLSHLYHSGDNFFLKEVMEKDISFHVV